MDQAFFSPELRILMSFVFAMFVTAFIIPNMVLMAMKKKLVALPGDRTTHKGAIPNLGGVVLFIAIMLSSWIFWDVKMIGGFQYKVLSIILVFLLGLMDDLMNISPTKKFIGEIVASLVLIVMGNVRLTNFHGYLGIHEIGYLASVGISFFVFLLIINAFNLIDGIDGLAAGIGIVTCTAYGIWFWLAGFVEHCILAGAVIGALLVFFYFNVFSRKYKIFMGDTGALMIGAVITIFTIQFNQQNIDQGRAYAIYAAPAVSMGILAIPLFDTLRVFLLRIIGHKSPFHGDRRHIHHMLLNLGLSHLQSTLILVALNICIVVLVFWLQTLKLHTILFLAILLGLMLLVVLILYTRVEQRKKQV